MQNLLPNGFPENGTDSKSESFGGLVFAMHSLPQCSIVNAEINPRDSRQGLTPAKDISKYLQDCKQKSAESTIVSGDVTT